jgi:hypothetical protein
MKRNSAIIVTTLVEVNPNRIINELIGTNVDISMFGCFHERELIFILFVYI